MHNKLISNTTIYLTAAPTMHPKPKYKHENKHENFPSPTQHSHQGTQPGNLENSRNEKTSTTEKRETGRERSGCQQTRVQEKKQSEKKIETKRATPRSVTSRKVQSKLSRPPQRPEPLMCSLAARTETSR